MKLVADGEMSLERGNQAKKNREIPRPKKRTRGNLQQETPKMVPFSITKVYRNIPRPNKLGRVSSRMS